LVFQNYALFPHLNVGDNIAFGLKIQKADRIAERVRDALKSVGLVGFEKRQPTTLSGGEQQRVALARAVVTSPRVLLLDEPLGALDLKLRKELQEELRRIQKELGMTFIHVTHDQEEALSMSDRVAVMRGGAIEQLGTPREIYENPASRYVAEFVGLGNFFEGTGNGSSVQTKDGWSIHSTARGEVTLLIRPERIKLNEGAGLRGRVEEALYLGSSASYIVSVGSRRLRVSGQTIDVKEGDSVDLTWRAEDVRVL
jgi:spermidine/putrescine transport system ATP-binding protein